MGICLLFWKYIVFKFKVCDINVNNYADNKIKRIKIPKENITMYANSYAIHQIKNRVINMGCKLLEYFDNAILNIISLAMCDPCRFG